MRMAEGLMKGLKQAIKMKNSEELLDHLIEENYRLRERLHKVSVKSQRRKKQIAHLTKGIARKIEKEKYDLALRGNEERTRQITMYANELAEVQNKWNNESTDLIKAMDDMEQVIELLKEEKLQLQEELQDSNERNHMLQGLQELNSQITREHIDNLKESAWTKLKKLFKR